MVDKQALITTGIFEDIGYEFPLAHTQWKDFPVFPGDDERFHIICITEGALVITDSEQVIGIQAPALLIFSHKVRVRAVEESNLRGWSIYFSPALINSVFSLDLVDTVSPKLDAFTFQDLCLLDAFRCNSKDPLRVNQEARILILRQTAFTALQALYERIANNLDKQADGYWPCRARACLLEIVMFIDGLYRQPPVDEAVKNQIFTKNDKKVGQSKIVEILTYLHSHYNEQLSLEKCSRHFGINRTLLNQLLTEHTKMTFVPYLRELRLHLAAGLLRETGLSLSEILESVGYGDISNFSRAFRARYLASPSQYRKRYLVSS